tara:strand:- start:20782 stop:22458 length:1677 start_codon:yes stop_codon:yes gene_type:complete
MKRPQVYNILFLFVLFGTLVSNVVLAQQKILNEKGFVNYISNDNYYLRFDNTENINVGDTIYLKNNGSKINSSNFSEKDYIPTFVVQYKSSTSILSALIVDEKPPQKTEVFSFQTPKKEKELQEALSEEKEIAAIKNDSTVNSKEEKTDSEISVEKKEHLYGRFTISDDNIISTENSSLSRLGVRLNLGVKNIANSRFSFDSYISYQHYFRSKNPRNAPNHFLGLYSLALSYSGPKQFTASLGRSINPKMSSLGVTDGIQMEKQIKKFYFGTITGFRPKFSNYMMDFNLFQLGAYAGFEHVATLIQSQTTVGYFDQQNSWKTDRRFLGFQHSTTLRNNLTFFTSAEMDLFERTSANQERNKLQFTSLYLSLNYRVTKKLSLFGSYDNRRNIIYYQTYFDLIDEMNANQINRQGVRFRVNYKLTKTISISGSYNTRLNPSDRTFMNLQGGVYFRKIPGIGGSFNYNLNRNVTSYMNSNIHSIRYSRTLTKIDVNFALYARILKYKYTNLNLENPFQTHSGLELSKSFKNNFNLGFNFEYYKQKFHNTFRFNVRLSKTIK